MKKVFSVFLIALVAVSFILTGCADENSTTYSSVSGGTTGSGAVMKGTVQGYLRDATTQEPIVGAVVDIGIATATTNQDGQYVLRDVPATQISIETNPDPNNVGNQNVTTNYGGSYFVTINMKGVTSPVAMGNTAARPRFSDFYFEEMEVDFETISNITTLATGSIGSTILVSTRDIYNHELLAGKMAATISGMVINSVTKQPVGAGYTVKLVTSGDSDNAGAGANGSGFTENVVSSTTTSANGTFTFANIESKKAFIIKAWDATPMTQYGTLAVTAPADNQTLYLLAGTTYAGAVVGAVYQAPVQVATIDAIKPFVIKSTPENNSDIGVATSANVVFTFSEPLKPTFYALGTASSVTGSIISQGTPSTLFQDVVVTYNGNKGPVAYSLAWDSVTAPTMLTVTVPNLAPASWYTVNIGNAVTRLTDVSGMTGSTTTRDSVKFSTSTNVTAAAPNPVVGYDTAAVNYNGGTVNLDWNPVAGAKEYNIYRRYNQLYSSGTNAGAYEWLANVNESQYAATIGLLHERNEIQLTADLAVTSINADGVESSMSTPLNVVDAVLPQLAAGTPCSAATVTVNGIGHTEVTVVFNEPMRETTVEQSSTNYIFAPAVAGTPTIRYNPTTTRALMTFSGLISNASYTLTLLNTANNITDLAGNALDITTNAAHICNFVY